MLGAVQGVWHRSVDCNFMQDHPTHATVLRGRLVPATSRVSIHSSRCDFDTHFGSGCKSASGGHSRAAAAAAAASGISPLPGGVPAQVREHSVTMRDAVLLAVRYGCCQLLASALLDFQGG
jgi:hypothetical protein